MKFERQDTAGKQTDSYSKWLRTNVATHFTVYINDSAHGNEGERAVTLD